MPKTGSKEAMKTAPVKTGCVFSVAWVGRCGKGTGKLCAEHKRTKCTMCKKQAWRSCDHTSALVCGAPLCRSCDHGHGYF